MMNREEFEKTLAKERNELKHANKKFNRKMIINYILAYGCIAVVFLSISMIGLHIKHGMYQYVIMHLFLIALNIRNGYKSIKIVEEAKIMKEAMVDMIKMINDVEY